MREGGGGGGVGWGVEKRAIERWEKGKKWQAIKLRLKGQQVLIMEAKLREMAG